MVESCTGWRHIPAEVRNGKAFLLLPRIRVNAANTRSYARFTVFYGSRHLIDRSARQAWYGQDTHR
jgi:hypothetical protein